MTFFDAHLHLTSEQFLVNEEKEILNRSYEAGVTAVMNVITDFPSLERSLVRASDREQKIAWYHAASTTPHDAGGEDVEAMFLRVEQLAFDGSLQAIGETGLDYHYEHSPKGIQKALFERYIDLALRSSLPLIIHCRHAFPDFFDMMAAFPNVRGVLHCFTGTLEEAKKLMDMDWYVSISGIITYKKGIEELRNVVLELRQERMLLETDSPYLAPVPCRGTRNEPALLPYIAHEIARLRGVSIDVVSQTTYENAKTLFGPLHEKRAEHSKNIMAADS